MDPFSRIPEEKQKIVINAAIDTFAANGYRKASILDIASSAGIAKSMVFHYFGSKKALYLFLLEHCSGLISEEMSQAHALESTDFFERIKASAKVKLSAMQRYPGILVFLGNAFNETDKTVEPDIRAFMANRTSSTRQLALEGVDLSRFKPDIDIGLVYKILMYLTEGYLSKSPVKTRSDMDRMVDELEACMNLLRNHFYKEACL